MTVLTKENFETEVEKHEGLSVIDLYADWCGPCKMLAPVIAELEGKYPNVKFCKINVDDERDLALSFRVQSIPTVAFVKENTLLDMSVGLVPAGKLEKLIEEYK